MVNNYNEEYKECPVCSSEGSMDTTKVTIENETKENIQCSNCGIEVS